MDNEKTISFISDRKHYIIPISDILYVFMKKQDAYVHVSNGSILKTRMTFAEFQDILSEEDFIRIHRGCLLFDITETKLSGDKTAGERAVLM